MPSKADMQQRLNELSSIIAEQAARIEALENEVASNLLAKAKKTKKGNKVSHSQLHSWDERLTFKARSEVLESPELPA